MQRSKINRFISLMFLVLLFASCSCSLFRTDGIKEERIREAMLELVVHNQCSYDILILPTDPEKASPRTIETGDSLAILFKAVVYNIKDPQASGNVEDNRLEAVPETPFLSGLDVNRVIRIKLDDDKEYSYSIEVIDGWFEKPPVLERLSVTIEGPPLSGIFTN